MNFQKNREKILGSKF